MQQQTTVRSSRLLSAALRSPFVLILSVAVGVYLAFVIAFRAIGQSPAVRDRVRQFNRQRLNPLTGPLAARSPLLYAIVHHVGRRSGRLYATPVVAARTADGFVIPLPYGSESDWCRNVLAAGFCTIEQGDEYTADEPTVIAAPAALAQVALPLRLTFGSIFGDGIHYLQLRRRP